MGFLSGRVTYVRFQVSGDPVVPFEESILEKARAHAIGRHGAADPTDGVSAGWAGGDHVLDATFELGKNVLDDALHLGMRVDTNKVPGALLRAYTTIETEMRALANPTGRPSKSDRQEAKEAARVRAEAEAADGRFRRMAHYPVLWDGRAGALYAGVTSLSVLDRLQGLFRETFDRTLEPISAGPLATIQAEARGLTRAIGDLGAAGFLGEERSTIAWTDSDPTRCDFWGNEFLLWLWHTLQIDGDTLTLPDGSEATLMFAKTLTLDCPRGETGRGNHTVAGPSRLPETFRALQAGKLPRKAGLIVVRQGAQYELTLQAETLAVSGAALPKIEGLSGHELRIARIESIRHLVETLDLIYDTYGRRRTGPDWSGNLGRIRDWLRAA